MKHKGREVNGIVLLDKPAGITSNGALQRVKRLFVAKKAGHTGSLDPLATGLLPICLGEATKVTPYLLNARKRYLATVKLGSVTDTADSDGKVVSSRPIPTLNKAKIEKILDIFIGDSEQIPPMYSAISLNGKRLYKLARKGEVVVREPRKINISELILVDFDDSSLHLSVTCSKGTYIRSLAVDIGEQLGCGAHISALQRTGVDPFMDPDMVTIEELQQLADKSTDKLDAVLLPMDRAIIHLPEFSLSNAAATRLINGLKIELSSKQENMLVRLYLEQDIFLGIGEILDDHLKAKRLVNTQSFREKLK